MNEPKWHETIPPGEVVNMIREMAEWLKDNDYAIYFTTDNCDISKIALIDKKLRRPDIYETPA